MDSQTVPTTLDRRRLLTGAGLLAGALATARLPGALAAPARPGYPFTLGVASGDPLPDSVVIWTRLAPEPLTADGGMAPRDVEVSWQLATDERFTNVIRSGTARALTVHAHSFRVEVGGLAPDRWYWYRFRYGGEVSRTGRTRTLPPFGAPRNHMRFAFASCSMYEHGYFNAYRHMAAEDLDLIVHLGDYIYEYGPNEYVTDGGNIRRFVPDHEIYTLADYRIRHAQYRTDPDLQDAHAAYPWIFTWDDHEVANDYADLVPEDLGVPTEVFRHRRAHGYLAYWEHLPLRFSFASPQGADLRLYRRLLYGDLAQFHVLDTRQYRDDQACAFVNDEPSGGGQLVDLAACPELLDPDRTLLGQAQERWVLEGLGRSQSHWNVLAQQYLMAYLDEKPGAGAAFFTDGWDGYQAARARILRFLQTRRVPNPVVIGGDIHSYWAADLKANFLRPDSPTVASEFVSTSVTADNVPQDIFEAFLPDNPHIKYFDATTHGYVLCDLNRQRWRTDFRVTDVRVRQAPVRTLASFEVAAGRPGVQKV